jgi:hypothetical protein
MAGEGTGAGTGTGAEGQGGVAGGDAVQAGQVGEMLSDYLAAPAAEGEKAPEEKPEGEKAPEPAAKAPEPELEKEKPVEAGADVKALQDQIKALSDKLEAALAKPTEKPKEAEKPLTAKYFNTPADFEAAFEKPENLEAILNKVRADAAEDATKNLPQMVTNIVRTQVTVMRAVDNFYTKNPDLGNKREFVSSVANELMGKNPGWSLNKLFNEELGKEVNKRLGTKPGVPAGKAPGQAPAPRGARRPAEKEPDLAPLQKEILDTIL